MPSREERRQAALSFVEPFLAEWRARSSDVHAAFRDWAVEQVLWDEGLSWEEIQDVTAIDGAGDMGIDAWYLKTDDSPAVLYLIQAKDTRPKREDLLKLRDGLVALFDPQRRGSASSEAKLRAAELSQFIETDLRVEFHLVTSELAARPLKDDAVAFNDQTIHLFEREVPCQFAVHDIEDLSQNIRVKHDRPIRFIFKIPKDNLFSFETASKFRTVTAAIDAKYLVDLFQTERTNLFRHNPRYYQTSKTNVNKDVLATLRSADRHNFFLYNNGLTTICDGLTVSWQGDTATVTAEDFQIVNGCQTTVTLHEAWRTGGGDPQVEGIHVLIRMIEEPSQSIARLIAQFTNSQNPMKAEDFRSNDDLQIRLHEEFDKLQPRWFYENKRGIWATEFRTPGRVLPTGAKTALHGISS